MTGESNPYKSALVDIEKIATKLDTDMANLIIHSELTQDELLSLMRNGLGLILTRVEGATLVEVLRDAQKVKDVHEDL
jgi:hypothetical protein